MLFARFRYREETNLNNLRVTNAGYWNIKFAINSFFFIGVKHIAMHCLNFFCYFKVANYACYL